MGKSNTQFNHLCSELVTIQFTDAAGRRQRTTANLEEIAPERLSLLVDARIPAGSRTIIETHGLTLRGRARRVEHNQNLGWFVEVRLAPDSRWSRSRYTPEHLLLSIATFCRHHPASKANT